MRRFRRDKTFGEPIVWLTTFFVIAFHFGAVAALFMFAWKPFVLAILLWWVAGSLRHPDGVPPAANTSRL